MASIYGFTGKLSGKMGSAVFRVREGQQIVTQYNPIVKNPNTEKQQGSRAAFKLMSQLGAIMQAGFGTMSTTERPAHGKKTQRNAFFELNYPLVEVDQAGEITTAKIAMENLKLTSSFRHLPELQLSGADGSITINMEAIPTEVSSVRVVVVGYKGDDITQASIVSLLDVPVNTESTQIGEPIPLSAGKYTVLAYGLIPSASASVNIKLDSIHTPADEDFISAVKLNEMVRDGLMAETMTVGANVTVTD